MTKKINPSFAKLVSHSLDLLDAKKIKKEITEEVIIEVFETITSTNNYLKLQKPNNIHFCLAEQQTAGRGRLNRAWFSPFGQNIYLSCRYPLQKDVSELAGLSLVVSLAILQTLKEAGINSALCVKWPNDVIYDHKKIAGTLIEVLTETHGLSEVIIGIGVNVNMLSDNDNITQDWISMRQILGKQIDRNKLVINLIKQLFNYLNAFKQNGFVIFANEWMHADSLTDQFVTLKNMDEKIQGTVVGIDDQGHLLLRLKNNTIKAFSAGDTSIVKKMPK